MADSRFVYVTYIRTTPEKLWQALTDPEFTRQYWVGTWQESDWKPGASWRIMIPDGRIADSGEIVEIEPHRKLVLRWRNEFKLELHAEGFSRMTYEIEPMGEAVKLTIITRSIGPTRSSFKRFPAVGHISWQASRAFLKRAKRWKGQGIGRAVNN
jgi:uncharacterized protein YndB with AHSA1/START domain